MNVQQFLLERSAEYDVLPHRETFDAQHLAQTLHVSGKVVAKTVLLKADHGFNYYVAVLPANKRVDFAKLSHYLCGCHLELAKESEVAKHCSDCEVGVLPPFGSQYGLHTVLDESLLEDEEIIFEGNSHREAIRMKLAEFRAIEQPLVCKFAV